MKRRITLVSAMSALAVSMMSGQAFAQAAPQATDQSPGLNEIVVTGIRLSVQSALDQKKNSDQLKDSIVAEDIGKLPDNNVIEALQHVTGVQISRNAAEATQLLIRGLPDIETLLNGREIFTSTGRFITLQDIPAELLARVDVEKSARADDIEGGIAGVIDVRLHRPFDFDGAEFAGTVRGTHSSLSERTDPTASVLASNRWNTDAGEFGLLADVSYIKDRYKEEILDNYISSQSIGPVPGSTGPGGIAYLPLTEGGQSILGDRVRESANLAAQWSPNANTEVFAEGFYTRYRNPNNDDFFVGLPWLGANAATATVFPGTDEVKTVTAGGYDLTSDQSFVPKTDTMQLASGLTWTSNNITLTSEVDYTNSKFSQTGYILDTEYYPPPNGYTADFNYNGTGTPYMNVTGIDMTNPANFHIRQLYDQWELQTGDEVDWRADLVFKLDSSSWLKSIATGVRFGDRFASNREDNQGGLDCRGAPDPASPTNAALVAAIASPACFTALTALPGVAYHLTGGSIFNGAFGLTNWTDASPTWLNNNIGYLRELFDQSPTGAPPPADPTQSFDDREKSYAIYGKANFGFDLGSHPLVGNFGLRVIDTQATMMGNTLVVSTPDNVHYSFAYTPSETDKNTIDWLPSLNARLSLEDDLFLRFAASKTVTRPTFAQLDPGLSLSASTATLLGSGTAGNPNLSPEKSTNADLSLEYYFQQHNALTGAVFYRQIDGYIQSGITARDIAGIVYQVTEPTNAPAGRIKGAEVGYTEFFDFLPGPFSGLGMQANATYVQGDFQNISKWSYNLIGMYEKGPASFRVAYNWRSGFDVGPASRRRHAAQRNLLGLAALARPVCGLQSDGPAYRYLRRDQFVEQPAGDMNWEAPKATRPALTRRSVLLAGAGLAALPFRFGNAQTLEALNPKLTGDLYPIHDPCIMKAGDTFYVFCTTPRADAPAQIPWYRSKDLMHWERGGHVLAQMPAWAQQEVHATMSCWAPDISFFNGKYSLYYACSTFGSNHSVIGLATNTTLNPDDPAYRWQDQGLVLESQTSDDFNALDPARVIDREGKHWLAFGSFWTGLKIIQLDPLTGKPLPDAPRHDLARRPKPPDAIEAVFIIQRAGNYYLFASFDFCCRGADSSYYTVVGRSSDILGPYADRSGKPMMEGGGTLVLAAGGGEPRWRGPGHIAILRDSGKDYIVYHAYDAAHDGRPTLRIAPLGWTEDNWPVAFV